MTQSESTPAAEWSLTVDASRRVHALFVVAIVALSFLAFAPALSGEFLGWDDQQIIVENAEYRGLGPANLKWMFSTTLLGHYQPLTWLSFALDHAVWGMNPFGYHLTNSVIHCVNAVLVYVLGLRLIGLAKSEQGRVTMGTAMAAGVGAALWAVHPLRVESVAWITERRDVLSTMFMALAMLAYLRSVRPGDVKVCEPKWLLLSVVALGLSLLSKAWGMTFFVLLIAVDWYPLRRLPESPFKWISAASARVLLQKLPFLILGVLAAAMAGRAQHSAIATKSIEEWGVLERCVQAIYGLWFYLRTTILPIDLSPLYELPSKLDPLGFEYWPAYVIVPLGLVLLVAFRRRAPAALVAGAVYAVMLAPVLGFLQSGDQFVADRYSYIATIGVAMILGWACVRFVQSAQDTARSARLRLVGAGAGVLLLVLTGLSAAQSTFWQRTETLWGRAATAAPGTIVHTNYALALLDANPPKTQEATEQLVLAVQADPTNGRALFTLGNILRDIGKLREAEQAYVEAIKHLPQKFMAQVNLGAIYLRTNEPEKALAAFRDAVADVEKGGRRPLSAMPYLALGDALRRTGDVEGARSVFFKALEFDETKAQAEAELRSLPPAPARVP